MDDVVTSLFERIDELERSLAVKDATIKILNEQLNSAKAPHQVPGELPTLEHQTSSRQAFKTDNLHFVSSLTGEEVILSFPESSISSSVPMLSRQQTIRTHLRSLLGETRQFFEAKEKLKRDLNTKIMQLEEENRLRIDMANQQYQ